MSLLGEIWTEIMCTSRMNTKGQITIPKRLRNRLGLYPEDQVECKEMKDGINIQKKVPLSRFY